MDIQGYQPFILATQHVTILKSKVTKEFSKEQFCPGFYNLVSFRWCKSEEAYSFCLGKVKLRKNTTFFYTFKEFIRVNGCSNLEDGGDGKGAKQGI